VITTERRVKHDVPVRSGALTPAVSRGLVVCLLVASLALATGCGSRTGIDKAGHKSASKPLVLTLANHEQGPDEVQAWADAVRRLSNGTLLIRVANNWRKEDLDYDRKTIGDVQSRRVALAKIAARAYDTVNLTSLQPFVAPFPIDTRALATRTARTLCWRRPTGGSGWLSCSRKPTRDTRVVEVQRPEQGARDPDLHAQSARQESEPDQLEPSGPRECAWRQVAAENAASSSRNVSRSFTTRRESVSSPCSSITAICERRRCRSMPIQRVPFSTVGPPLELSGRAALIRAVSNLQFETEGRPPAAASFCPGRRGRPPLHDIKRGGMNFLLSLVGLKGMGGVVGWVDGGPACCARRGSD
jgi:hypothetical protein